jgi:sterol 3beta-glucosyltransferase
VVTKADEGSPLRKAHSAWANGCCVKITILAYGSRGDVQPYIALGKGLQRVGHCVRLTAPDIFADFVTQCGLEFTSLPGDPTQLMRDMTESARTGTNWLRVARVVLRHTFPLVASMYMRAREACRGADVVIHTLLMTLLGHQIARELEVPDLSALVFATFAPTAAFPSPALPKIPLGARYNYRSHEYFTRFFWHGSRLAYWWLQRDHPELPSLAGWPFRPYSSEPTPILYGFSPHVLPKPPEWGEDIHVTGYWFLERAADWRPPPDLVAFLQAGPPPVFAGFGSVIPYEAEKITAVLLEALRRSGQRGVLQSGWGGLIESDLPDGVMAVDSISFDWLFPRTAAVVNHAGMGTTAEVLRAGVPSVTIPFIADQFFWARRVHQLGVGPKPIPYKKLSVERLTEAISTALEDQAMRRRATELGARLRSEDGTANAVEIIEGYLNAG